MANRRELVKRRSAVRNIRKIAETLAEHGTKSQDPDVLSAAVRVALGRSIVQSVAGMRAELPVLTLEPELERILNESVQEGGNVGLEPAMMERLHKTLSDKAQKQEIAGEPAVLLVAPPVRPWMARMMRNIRNLTVLAYNEVPDDRRIAEVGWNRARMATVIRAMGDGAFLGEYFDGTRRYNIILRAEDWFSPEELGAIPVATADGRVHALGELVRVQREAGPSSIRRVDRRRTLTLQVTPPPAMPMEEALAIVQDRVAPAIMQAMPQGGTIKYRGTAEALEEALTSMTGSFLLAVVILYLLISALFRSFRDSLLVILTLPMATVGGILSLRLVDFAARGSGGQPMDLLTMIGFIILLGLVVNNAILLVYRARDAEREGLGRRDAVESAVRLRLRPILMSTTTSIFGMLPLMLIPGAGTELYRGMAAVIVGGMLLSTLFTLILLPSLLRVNEERVPTREAVPEAS